MSADFPHPQAPALTHLLGRATRRSLGVTGMDATLFKLFAVPVAADADLPVAAVTYVADSGEADTGWWLRADPVNLYADLQQVLLFDARGLDIQVAEAQSLAAEFNRLFADQGLVLEVLRPDRWYIRLLEDPGLRTLPLWDAIGRDITPLLPRGVAGSDWRKLLTEVQMLFYGHKINRAREAEARPSINSVWFWGGGPLPRVLNPVNHQVIYASDPLAQGLAKLANLALRSLPETASAWCGAAGGEEQGLVVLEATRYDSMDQNAAAWVEHIKQLEKAWFGPALALLENGQVDTVRLYPGEGNEYSMMRRATWRFWRRPRSLLTYIQQQPV